MSRPFPPRDRSLARSARFALALLVVALFVSSLTACATPGAIGVQDTGTVQGRVIDNRSNLPISGALVNVGSLYTTRTDPQGVFQLMVPTGDQMVSINANGYLAGGPFDVTVVKDMVVNVGSAAIGLTPVNPSSS